MHHLLLTKNLPFCGKNCQNLRWLLSASTVNTDIQGSDIFSWIQKTEIILILILTPADDFVIKYHFIFITWPPRIGFNYWKIQNTAKLYGDALVFTAVFIDWLDWLDWLDWKPKNLKPENLKSENLKTWKSENLKTWKPETLKIWKPEIWKPESLKSENLKNWKPENLKPENMKTWKLKKKILYPWVE